MIRFHSLFETKDQISDMLSLSGLLKNVIISTLDQFDQICRNFLQNRYCLKNVNGDTCKCL